MKNNTTIPPETLLSVAKAKRARSKKHQLVFADDMARIESELIQAKKDTERLRKEKDQAVSNFTKEHERFVFYCDLYRDMDTRMKPILDAAGISIDDNTESRVKKVERVFAKLIDPTFLRDQVEKFQPDSGASGEFRLGFFSCSARVIEIMP